jgi:hypothetical protein
LELSEEDFSLLVGVMKGEEPPKKFTWKDE